MKPALCVLTPGYGATVQDLGRFGACHLGVPPSGALDDYAHRVANWLVGNAAACASLELPLGGLRLEVLTAMRLAITGARMEIKLNGTARQQWSCFAAQPGDVLELGLAENGCRGYLAIAGGVAVPEVMGSRSTYLGGKLGGLEGRTLVAGDILPGDAEPVSGGQTRPLPWTPVYPERLILRAIAGPHAHLFRHGLDRFFTATFTVSPRSNRMGCRLAGQTVTRDAGAPASIVSEPVVPGNVQIPADGQPILLLREQTIGGYTAIATVISADLWRIGQAKPGDTVRFLRVGLEEGQRLGRQWREFLAATERLLTAGQRTTGMD